MIDNRKKDHYVLISKVMGSVFLLLALIGVCFFGWQVVHYLKTGYWTAISIIRLLDVFPSGNSFVSWVQYPQSWFGLHKIIRWIFDVVPLSLFLVAVGTAISVYFFNDAAEMNEIEKKQP